MADIRADSQYYLPAAHRRRFLQRGVALTAAAVALLSGVTLSRRAAADSKAPQMTVQYQDKPKDGKACATCNFFEAPSSCKSVEGSISPQGWCMLYAAKA